MFTTVRFFMVLSSALALCPSDDFCKALAPGPLTSTSVSLSACTFMYCNGSYTESGVPCGFGTDGEADCVGDAPISFANPWYSASELDALVVDLSANTLDNGNVIDAGLYGNNGDQHIEIEKATTMNVTFLTEGACFQNVMGLITWPTFSADVGLTYPRNPAAWTLADRSAVLDIAEISIFYINADDSFCNDQTGLSDGIMCAPTEPQFCRTTSPNLETGTTMRMVPDPVNAPSDFVFRARTSVSFFILPDGFTSDLRSGTFGDSPDEKLTDLLFAVPALNDPSLATLSDDLGSDLRQHTVVFAGPMGVAGADFSEMIIFSFEDNKRGPVEPVSNLDFDDLTFMVDVDADCVANPPPPGRPTGSPSTSPTLAICEGGLISDCGNVCCDERCGACGGCDCASRGFGGLSDTSDLCCPGTILESEVMCMTSADRGCIIDADLECAPSTSGC